MKTPTKKRARGGGRKKKPSAIKKLNGNPGKRKVNQKEPQYGEITHVDPPTYMKPDGKKVWHSLIGLLIDEGVLQVTDLHVLEVFCNSYAVYRLANRKLNQMGILITTPKGDLKKNPAATLINETTRQMATYGAMLGLDPASRQALTGTGGEEEDALDQLLKARAQRG